MTYSTQIFSISNIIELSEENVYLVEIILQILYSKEYLEVVVMLDGMLILWTVLTVLPFAFIVYDLIVNTPEAGMIPVMVVWGSHDPLARNPASLHFWGMMSFATIVGGFIAFPINRWLVAKGLKHGMVTVRKGQEGQNHIQMHHVEEAASQQEVCKALLVSLIGLAIGIAIAVIGVYV